MTKRRRECAQQFKEEAVRQILEYGYKITEAVMNLGVQPKYPTQVKEYSFRRNRYKAIRSRQKQLY